MLEILKWVVLIGVPVCVVVWPILSFKIVGPDEMAVRVYFGHPIGVCDSGLRFVPFFFWLTYLVRYPKRLYELKFPQIEVLTKEGDYKGKRYGTVKADVDAAAYLNFPRPDTPPEPNEAHPLIKILRADIPTDEVKLQAWTEEAVESACRLALGNVTWKQAAEEIDEISRRVFEIFKDSDGALIKAGFREPGIKLAISKIRLPKDVEEALTGPEKTRLAAEAAEKDAEAQAIDRLETVLYAIARSEGRNIGEVKERVKNDQGLRDKLLSFVMELHADLEKADRRSYYKLDSSGNPFLDAITLWKQLTGGQGNPRNQGNQGNSLPPPPPGMI